MQQRTSRIKAHLNAAGAIIRDAENLNKKDPKGASTRIDPSSVPVVAIRAHLEQALRDIETLEKELTD